MLVYRSCNRNLSFIILISETISENKEVYCIDNMLETVDDVILLQGLEVNVVFFFQAEDGIRDLTVTGVQTCPLPIFGGGHQVAQTRRLSLDPSATSAPPAR